MWEFFSSRAERESVVAFVQRWSLGGRETSCRGRKKVTVRIITDNMIKRKRESKQRERILGTVNCWRTGEQRRRCSVKDGLSVSLIKQF